MRRDADGVDDVEAAHARHLHVEQHEIGPARGHGVDGVAAAGGFADAGDVLVVLEQHPQPGPREGFVVDDERVERRAAGHRAATWPGSVPARNGVTGSSHSRNGSVSVTMAPPSSALASVSDARSP